MQAVLLGIALSEGLARPRPLNGVIRALHGLRVKVVVCITLVAPLLNASIAPASASDFREVDAFVSDLVETYEMPGAALVILDADGVLHEFQTGGWEDLDKTVPIASASFMLSTIAILRLVDRGIMRLDDTVAEYFPQVEGPAGAITLRQTLAQTSGQRAIFGQGFVIPGDTLEESADIILSRPQDFAPGRAFAYGPMHAQIAGRMAEIATGKSWHQIFAEEVVAPLGLRETGFGPLLGMDVQPLSIENLSIETVGEDPNPRISGGARSSASDLLKVLSMLLNEGLYLDESNAARLVLRSESVDAMLSDQTNGAFVARSYHTDKSYRYGFGMWMVTRSETGTVYNTADGAFGTIPWIDRRHGIAGLLITLGNYSDWIPESIALKDLVADTLD